MMTNESGLTYIELIISLVILGILSSIVLPLSEMTVKRAKEIELRRNLREIRQVLDKYKENYDKGMYGIKIVGASGYPKTLQELVDKKILRQIPKNPLTNSIDWETRSYSDSYDSTLSNKMDVYDVYVKSDDVSLDGSKYNTW